jgi:hypothetical protein
LLRHAADLMSIAVHQPDDSDWVGSPHALVLELFGGDAYTCGVINRLARRQPVLLHDFVVDTLERLVRCSPEIERHTRCECDEEPRCQAGRCQHAARIDAINDLAKCVDIDKSVLHRLWPVAFAWLSGDDGVDPATFSQAAIKRRRDVGQFDRDVPVAERKQTLLDSESLPPLMGIAYASESCLLELAWTLIGCCLPDCDHVHDLDANVAGRQLKCFNIDCEQDELDGTRKPANKRCARCESAFCASLTH